MFYKFLHSQSNHEFYFLFDIQTNLPSTIPMDLATFLVYLKNTNKSLSDFLNWYKKEKHKWNSNFEVQIPENKRYFLYQQVHDSDSLQLAIDLKDEINACEVLLKIENLKSEELKIFITEELPKTIFEFRDPKYYSSLKDLYIEVSRIDEEGDDLPF